MNDLDARIAQLAEDFREYLYRVASQVPFEHAEWAQQRGAALLEQIKSLQSEPGMMRVT